jgi:hypothetical protein
LNFLRKRVVKIVCDPALPFEEAVDDWLLFWLVDCGQAGDGFASSGNDDVVAGGGEVDKLGELGFGFVDVEGLFWWG